jgi:hypothetical protein
LAIIGEPYPAQGIFQQWFKGLNKNKRICNRDTVFCRQVTCLTSTTKRPFGRVCTATLVCIFILPDLRNFFNTNTFEVGHTGGIQSKFREFELSGLVFLKSSLCALSIKPELPGISGKNYGA